MGAPFTFVATADGGATAPGQIDEGIMLKMKQLLTETK
jgi:hypothetical protein